MATNMKYHPSRVVLTDYKVARDFITAARKSTAWRPVRTWGGLTACEGNMLVLACRAWGTSSGDILRFRPDNTIEFLMPENRLSSHAMTIAGPLERVTKLRFARMGKDNYAVCTEKDEAQYRRGLVMDCATRKFINPTVEVPIEEKRKEYLRALKDYRYHLKVRAMMGLYDELPTTMASYAGTPSVETVLTRDLTERQYPPRLIIWFLRNGIVTYGDLYSGTNHIRKQILSGFDRIVKSEDRTLRRAYGVYEYRAADTPVTGVAAP